MKRRATCYNVIKNQNTRAFGEFIADNFVFMRKRNNNFKDSEPVKPSNFVLDLRKRLPENEKAREGERGEFRSVPIEDFYEKLENFNFKEFLAKTKRKLNETARSATAWAGDKQEIAKKTLNSFRLRLSASRIRPRVTSKFVYPEFTSIKIGKKKKGETLKKTKSSPRTVSGINLGEAAKKAARSFVSGSRRAMTGQRLWPVASFAVILLLLVLPFKAFTYYKSFSGLNDLRGNVLGTSERAVNHLLSAGQLANEMDFKEARDNFNQAADQFLAARNELEKVNNILFKLASVAPDEHLRLASESKNILAAGERASELGKNLSLAMDGLLGDKKAGNMNEALDDFIKYGERALAQAADLETLLYEIDLKNIPAEFLEKFKLARKTAGFLREGLEEFMDLARAAQVFLGDGDFKRYLVVFQNNAEMRATGGFIGSYALVDFSNGKLKNIEVPAGGSYDTEGGLREKIIAPEPLWLVNPLWHFWDANWWPDWPTSAKKLEWFYEKSGGPTVDGVIGLTPTVLEKVLAIIGPVDMTEKYGVVITAENFWETTREIIEKNNSPIVGDKTSSAPKSSGERQEVGYGAESSRPTGIHAPKKIIGDLTRKIIGELPSRLNKKTLVGLMRVAGSSLNEKQILFYFNDKKLQDKVEEYGWDGSIRYTARDYLSVVNTNIAGGKSDRKIKEDISVETQVNEDGSIINTVKIRRTHLGSRYENFSGVRNVNWMRVYVPLGSKLIKAGGFTKPDDIYFERPDDDWREDPDVLSREGDARIDEASGTKIYEETGKTVFANWSMVDPGEAVTVYLKYKLPFRFQKKEPYTIAEKIKKLLNPEQKELYSYALLAQKQAGSYNSEISSTLILPDNMNIVWYFPKELTAAEKGWRVNEPLNSDKYWAAIIAQ